MNVQPVFPPQSPELPVIADIFPEPAPAFVMSCKSRFENVKVPQERVRAVPCTSEFKKSRLITLFPAIVQVPDTVWEAPNRTWALTPADPVTLKVEKVFAPFSVRVLVNVVFVCKVPYVRPPPLNVVELLPTFIVELAALNVMPDELVISQPPVEVSHVVVPSVIARVLAPLAASDTPDVAPTA